MATLEQQPISISNLPFDQPVIDKNGMITDAWERSLSQLVDFLSNNLSQLGHFISPITTSQRDMIKNPQFGQLIANKDIGKLQVWEGSSWLTK